MYGCVVCYVRNLSPKQMLNVKFYFDEEIKLISKMFLITSVVECRNSLL